MNEQIYRLQDINLKNDALIQSYKEKNDRLSTEITNLQPIAELNTSLKEDNIRLKNEFDTAQKEIAALKESAIQVEKEYLKKLQAEIERITTEFNIEKEKIILDMRIKHQNEVTALHERFTDKVSELLQQREKVLASRHIKSLGKNQKLTTTSDSEEA